MDNDTEFGPLASQAEKTCGSCGSPVGEWPMAHRGDAHCSQACALKDDGITEQEAVPAPEGGFGCGT